jgi:hypothetical protein
MKISLIIIFSVLLSGYTVAQNNIVNIGFEVDGKTTVYKDAVVKFINDKDTISINIEDGKLTIPAPVFKKRVTVIFYIDHYFLKFDSIPVTLNSLSPKWTVGVDKKPFDKKKHWVVKSWKKVQIVYYLNNDDGRTFTVDSYKKSKVIMRRKPVAY